MRCVKCAAQIDTGQCPQCGFDHTKGQIRFLLRPAAIELQISESVNAGPKVSVLNQKKNRNAESLVKILSEVRNEQIKEKTATTPDGRFEIFDEKVLRKYHGAEEMIAVPSNIVHIAQGAFSGNRHCMSVELPDGLESIGSVAFAGCTALENIHLPHNLKEIGIRSFAECRSLKQIEIPGSVVIILPSAFSQCTSLERVVLQEGIKKVDTDVFSGCSKLKEICMPDSVQEMKPARGGRLPQHIQIHASEKWLREHDDFFQKNPNYIPVRQSEEINTPINVLGSIKKQKEQAIPVESDVAEFETEGTKLLKYKGNKEHVVIPTGITEIGKLAFSNNKTLRTVQLPDSLRALDTWAFDGCRNLEHIVFPSQVESLGTWAFGNCEKLERVTLPSRLSELKNWVFRDCKNLKDVILQPGIQRLDLDAFEGCDNLQRIQIPDSVEVIKIFFWKPSHSIRVEGASDWIQKNRAFFERNPSLIPVATGGSKKLSPEEQYQRGYTSEKNNEIADAEKWYRLAAEAGFRDAQDRLGRLFWNRDPNQAFFWLKKAADQGHVGAQCSVSWCYEDGRGVAKDVQQAFRYMLLAAESGFTYAQQKVSEWYDKGFGVEKDLTRAKYWKNQAAGQ